jgi:hypothetical protein
MFIVRPDVRAAATVADTLWLMGKEPGKPGARIVETYNLIERGLAWRDDVTRTPELAAVVAEVEDRFTRTLC